MSIKGTIERDVRVQQRGTRLTVGDQFWRGLRVVTILSVRDGQVRFRDMATGLNVSTPRGEFVSLALTRIPKPSADGDYLKMVWAIVGNGELTRRYRYRYAKQIIKQASADDAETVAAWMRSLENDQEPTR